MIQELLKQRKLPALPDAADFADRAAWRAHLLEILSENEFGVTPKPLSETYSFVEERVSVAGGTATEERIRLSVLTPAGMFSFPFRLLLPSAGLPCPVFLHIAFNQTKRTAVRDHGIAEHIPEMELADNGFGLATLFYEDVTSDSGARDGLALAYPLDREDSWGTIGMWAFAASRVMDYLCTRKDIDSSRVSVSGWSRLGKTALWCAAQDERFSLAISNQSGCSGAALQRGKVGENVRDITSRFPFWFCRKYRSYAENEDALPLDQHYLLALLSPRCLFVSSAENDKWADPTSEFLCAAASSRAWETMGEPGLVSPDEIPAPDTDLLEGKIGYRIRRGEHSLLRGEWQTFMNFRRMHNV